MELSLLGKKGSEDRKQIVSVLGLLEGREANDLAQHLETELLMEKTFIVGEVLTAADLIAFGFVAPLLSKQLSDEDKLAMPNVFRWVDNIQHLPGLLDFVQARDLFTAFPTEQPDESLAV